MLHDSCARKHQTLSAATQKYDPKMENTTNTHSMFDAKNE